MAMMTCKLMDYKKSTTIEMFWYLDSHCTWTSDKLTSDKLASKLRATADLGTSPLGESAVVKSPILDKYCETDLNSLEFVKIKSLNL